jgi:hypothetical protein
MDERGHFVRINVHGFFELQIPAVALRIYDTTTCGEVRQMVKAKLKLPTLAKSEDSSLIMVYKSTPSRHDSKIHILHTLRDEEFPVALAIKHLELSGTSSESPQPEDDITWYFR